MNTELFHKDGMAHLGERGERIAWFCIRTQPKHEHIAAAHLSRLGEVEVFNPRLRKRSFTKRGLVWATESLFPNYIFAHFDFHALLDRVTYTPAVGTVIHFGHSYPSVPEGVVEELRREFPEDEPVRVPDPLRPGTRVLLTENPFCGLQGVILRTLPAKQRVQVLMEMLGSACRIEVDVRSVIPETSPGPAALPVLSASNLDVIGTRGDGQEAVLV